MSATRFACLAIAFIFLFTSCGKDNDPANEVFGSGKFTVNGVTYSGVCVAVKTQTSGNNGMDVSIVSDDYTGTCIITNMSAASSGTSSFSGSTLNTAGKTPAIIQAGNLPMLESATGGNITKTSAKSFTFSGSFRSSSGSSTYNVTGSGTWK